MKTVLLLATSEADAKIILWCLKVSRNGYRTVVVGNLSKSPLLPYSPLCARFYPIPEQYSFRGKSPEIVSLIEPIIKKEAIDIILPTGFDSVQYLSQYNGPILGMTQVLPVPSLQNIASLENKHAFALFAQQHQIPHPQTLLLESLDLLEAKSVPLPFPLLTKPMARSAGCGIHRFDNEDDLLEYLSSPKSDRSNILPLLLQEFIFGTDIDLNVFAREGRIVAWTIQRFLNIPRDHAPPLRWLQFVKQDEVLRIGAAIVKSSHYSGPLHLDLRVDERSGKVFAIEANPRFWASTFCSNCDGVNFPEAGIRSAFDPSYSVSPRCSGRIWGSPHRLPQILCQHRNRQTWSYAASHTWLQLRFILTNLAHNRIAVVKRALRPLQQSQVDSTT